MIRKKALSLAVGAALAIGMGTVTADEPMGLTDGQMDAVTAGSGFAMDIIVSKQLEISELIEEQKVAIFFVATDVSGISAVAQASSDAVGPNADSQTHTFSQIEDLGDGLFKANALSKSIALVDPRAMAPRTPPAPGGGGN